MRIILNKQRLSLVTEACLIIDNRVSIILVRLGIYYFFGYLHILKCYQNHMYQCLYEF